MRAVRAINKNDLENYNKNEDIHCTLFNSYKNKEIKKRSKNVDEYYRLCLEGKRKYALDSIAGHVSGKRLSVNVSPWISTTTDFDFALREYAIPQTGNYNYHKERKTIILMDIPNDKILSGVDEIKQISDSVSIDDFAIDLRNDNLNILYNNAILSEKYNEDMPGYDVVADCNRLYNNIITSVEGFSNFATSSSEILIFSKIKREYIKLIIYPLLQDILYSCNVSLDENNMDLINNLVTYGYKMVDKFFEELYPTSTIGNNLTDYLINHYDKILGNTIEDKYRNLKILKLNLLKQITKDINANMGTNLVPTKVVDDNILVSSYHNINNFSKRQTYDILIIEKDGQLYRYDTNTHSYISEQDLQISKKEVSQLILNRRK